MKYLMMKNLFLMVEYNGFINGNKKQSWETKKGQPEQ